MDLFSFIPQVSEVLQFLQDREISSVIVTNGHHEVQREKLKACKAFDYFPKDQIIIGGEEVLNGKEEKPAATIFLKACQIVGCEPHEAIHVGDNLATDIQASRFI